MRSFIVYYFFLLSLISYSNTVIVVVDHTSNLDYFVNGKKFRLKKDLKKLKKEYFFNSTNRLILVNVTSYHDKKMKGKILIVGNEKKINKRFKSSKELELLILENTISNVDFLLLSHTISSKRLDKYLSLSNSRYDLILASACKMASVEKLKIMSRYTNYVVASPENIHLAHFDLNQTAKNLKGEAIDKAKLMIDRSFERLLSFTKSNLVLNLYQLDKNLLNSNLCVSKKIDGLILYKRIKLSLFEKKSKFSNSFKLTDCQ